MFDRAHSSRQDSFTKVALNKTAAKICLADIIYIVEKHIKEITTHEKYPSWKIQLFPVNNQQLDDSSKFFRKWEEYENKNLKKYYFDIASLSTRKLQSFNAKIKPQIIIELINFISHLMDQSQYCTMRVIVNAFKPVDKIGCIAWMLNLPSENILKETLGSTKSYTTISPKSIQPANAVYPTHSNSVVNISNMETGNTVSGLPPNSAATTTRSSKNYMISTEQSTQITANFQIAPLNTRYFLQKVDDMKNRKRKAEDELTNMNGKQRQLSEELKALKLKEEKLKSEITTINNEINAFKSETDVAVNQITKKIREL
ncbi:11538_t:CDS:2 [Acaulospora morrowiae]|uniref:11538_t:CDS:1 n=1 Tax=Acaulospora morrowiae TaxID=94023 RepID=A0A9N8Z5S5_9GLOM|nr:11538_t:CDS:2 [Acaulospora morrowiae]